MIHRYLLSGTLLSFAFGGFASSAQAATSRHLYQIHERKVQNNERRADERTLTFSGDVAKIIALANQKARNKVEAEANKDNEDAGEDLDVSMSAGPTCPTPSSVNHNESPLPNISETGTLPAATSAPEGPGSTPIPPSLGNTNPMAPSSTPAVNFAGDIPSPETDIDGTDENAEINSNPSPASQPTASSNNLGGEGEDGSYEFSTAPVSTNTNPGDSSVSSSPTTTISSTTDDSNTPIAPTTTGEGGDSTSPGTTPSSSPGSSPTTTSSNQPEENDSSNAENNGNNDSDNLNQGQSPTSAPTSGSDNIGSSPTQGSPSGGTSNTDQNESAGPATAPVASPTVSNSSGSGNIDSNAPPSTATESNGSGPATAPVASPTVSTSGGSGNVDSNAPPSTATESNGSGSGSGNSDQNESGPTSAPVASPADSTSGGSGNVDSIASPSTATESNGSGSGNIGSPTVGSPSIAPILSPTSAIDDNEGIGIDNESTSQPTLASDQTESDGELSTALPTTEDLANAAIDIETDADLSPVASPTTSDSGLNSPTSFSDPATSLITCEGASLDRPEFIYFTYSLETETSNYAVLENIRKATESALSNNVARLLLPCDARRLQEDNELGFQGIDSIPEDTYSEETTCNPSENVENECTVLDGVIAVYISEGVDFELTNYYALTAIREALGSVDDQVTGLVQSTYLGPEIVNPSALETSDADNGSLTNDPGSTSTSLVLFAVGGCAVLASVGLIYYLRRRNRNGDSGEATMAAGTDDQGFSPDGTDRPLSPFSEMLPSAYRFDQDGNMSAIMELDDESATQRSGIVVSDSGFTTEEENSLAISSFDGGSSSMNRSGSPVLLGARKRPPEESTDSLLELL